MNSTKIKFILLALSILFIVMLTGLFKYKYNQDAKRLYKQGLEYYNSEKYQDAYYNFKQISKFSNLYTVSLIKQFQCANNLSDKKTAHAKIKELTKQKTSELVRPYILYNEANLAYELEINSDSQSLKKFKYINKTYPDSDFSAASAYKIAKLSKDKNLSKQKYIEYLTKAPNGRYAKLAIESIEELGGYLSKEDKERLANVYLNNQNYKQALNLYKETEFASNWYNIAKCYQGLKLKNEEKNTLINGLELKSSDIEEKEISQAIDRLITITNSGKFQTLQNLYEKHPDTYILPTVAYKLAQISTSVRSIKLYEQIANNYTNSYWAPNSSWEVFWYNWHQKRYKVCITQAASFEKLYPPSSQDAPRIAYWGARALLKEQKNKDAKDAFYKIIKKYPLSYYSFLSAKQLKKSKENKLIIKKPLDAYNINNINKFIFKDTLLIYLAQTEDFKTIEDFKLDDEIINSWILNKKENYPLSIKTIKDNISNIDYNDDNEAKIDFSDYRLKLMYPIIYEQEINNYAKQFKQSPYLFLSLIREESHFDKNAKSSQGAMGLAQIMPDTARFIEKAPVAKETLYNKDENIRIGLKYFSYLIEYFQGNEYLAILSYNAGPGNIDKWLKDPNINIGDLDAFVENIPYIETKNYIKKILSSYWIYINIYSPKNK